MKSKTSFFDWTVFKKTILRFWPVWAAYSAIWFVAMPLDALLLLRMDARDPGWGSYLQRFAQDTVRGLSETSLWMAVVFGVLAAMAVCSHLYNARSANFFGALPVRREGLFLTHYLAGLAFFLVPNAAIFLLTLAVEAAGGAVYAPQLLFWLGVTCGECLFFYSMAVFCGMFTGHILALPAFYAIFNALAYALYVMLEGVFNSFYYGFGGFENGVSKLVAWLTPVLRLARGVDAYPEMCGLDIVAAYAAAGVALTAGSFLLYRARRLESAGDVVSVKCMRPVFKYSVAVCSGLFFGMMTAEMVSMHEPGLMISILVWAVAGYFAAQMLLDKTFKVFRKWKGAAVVAAVFILMYLVVGFDLTGYEGRVPAADQVDRVEIYGISVDYLGDSADFLGTEESNPALIQLAILLHRSAVDQRDAARPSGAEGTSLNLTYHLKNGSTLTRRYSIWVDAKQAGQEGSVAWAVQRIYDDRDLYWKAYGFEEAERRMAEENCRLESAMFTDDNSEDMFYYSADAQALYEAVKEDFLAGRIGVRSVSGENRRNSVRRVLVFSFAAPRNEGNYDSFRTKETWWIEIHVQSTASSTLAVLERLEAAGAGSQEPSDLDAGSPYTAWADGEAVLEPVPTSEVSLSDGQEA